MRGVKTVASWLAGLGILAGIVYDSVSLHKNQKAIEQTNAASILIISSELDSTKNHLLRTQQELSIVQQEYGARERELHKLAQEHQSYCTGAHEGLIRELMRDRDLCELGMKDVRQQIYENAEDARTREFACAKQQKNLEHRILKTEKGVLESRQALGLVEDPLMEHLRNQCVRISSKGVGSGTIVAKEKTLEGNKYFVLTAYHVLEGSMCVNQGSGKLEFSVPVTLRCADGSKYACSVVLGKSSNDLALISFEARNQYPVARIASRKCVVPLDSRVYSVGHPLGVIDARITEGKMSAITSSEGVTYFHPTAPSIYGCSGGGVYDAKGKLIGVNRAVAVTPLSLSGSPLASLLGERVNVALPTMPLAIGLAEVHKTFEPNFAGVCCASDIKSANDAVARSAKNALSFFVPKDYIDRAAAMLSHKK